MIEESKNGFFNEAIVIGLLTAFCYIAGYLYETGYKGYYHLPDTFVEIGLTTIVKSTWKIIKALVTTLLVVNLISYSSTKELKFASSGLDNS